MWSNFMIAPQSSSEFESESPGATNKQTSAMYCHGFLTNILSVVIVVVVVVVVVGVTVSGSIVPDNEEERVNHIVNIHNLTEHCDEKAMRCRNFNFPNADFIAFFDLQTEVRIAPDGATYDVGGDQHLTSLTFENSTFVNFPLHLFYSLELSELDMRNCSIRHVTWENFLMANKLVILLLSDNDIIKLESNTFNYASELQFLFLNNNRLHALYKDTFKGLDKLQHLDLDGNHLNNLPIGIFDELKALQEIHLAENRLHRIDNDLFAHNQQLRIASMHTNRLRDLGKFAFRTTATATTTTATSEEEEQQQRSHQQLQHLQLVDVSNNQQLVELLLELSVVELWARNCSLGRVNVYGRVTNIDLRDNRLSELFLSAPETCEQLVLRNNSLRHLSTLTDLSALRRLDVADNPQLEELPNGWQTPSLEILNISNTGQIEIPLKALQGMPELRELSIANNNISEIDPHAFEQLSQLKKFFLHGNNWNCFNLNLIMQLLIQPNAIAYRRDNFDSYFPGEYINNIACMYRLPEEDFIEEKEEVENEKLQQEVEEISELQQAEKLIQVKQEMEMEITEVEKLRNELKTMVQFFEQKFDVVFEQLQQLNEQMEAIKRINYTLWNQVTLTV